MSRLDQIIDLFQAAPGGGPLSSERVGQAVGLSRQDAGFVCNLLRTHGVLRQAKALSPGGRAWRLVHPVNVEKAA